jgi:glycosyltransferase involved in cell wall biosynthesis
MFSLVIPTRNRAEILIQVLSYLESLSYPRSKFEVIVVNDGSSDGTASMLEKLEVGYRLRVYRQEPQGTSAARNFAIRQAAGSHILFIDDDVFPAADLLEHHEEAHRGHLSRLVRGPVINIDSLPLPQHPPTLLYHWSQNYLCTSNASLRRSLLLDAGLFDTGFPRWEDAELGVRLKRLGVGRHFVLGGYVFHLKPPVATESRLQTARRDGESAALLLRRYPGLRMKLRSGLHPVNYFRTGLLTAAPLRRAYQRYLQAQPKGRLAGLAEKLLVQHEYLQSGRKVLRQTQAAGAEPAPPRAPAPEEPR